MNELKNMLLIGCFSWVFFLSSALMADTMVEPNVMTLNGVLRVYETSKGELLKFKNKDGFDVSYDHGNLQMEGDKGILLFDKIYELYLRTKDLNKSTSKEKVHGRSSDRKIRISLDVSKDTIVSITVDYDDGSYL